MEKVKYDNHYKYLERHLPEIFEKVGINWDWNKGIISAHGDKGYGYKNLWKEAEIEFPHAMAIYLISYCKPYSEEVRNTKDGWIKPDQWVVDNYDRFKEFLSPNEHEPYVTFYWRNGIRKVIETLEPDKIIERDSDDIDNKNFYIMGICYDYKWDEKKHEWEMQ